MQLSRKQKDILIGTLLGDAHLEKNGANVRLRIDHQESQRSYLEWKYSEFQNLPCGKLRLVSGVDKRNDCNALRLNTDSFSLREQGLLQECLRDNFQINSKLHKKGKYWNIYIPSTEAAKFCRVVKPYIISGMEYKIFDPVTTESIRTK